MPNDEMQRLWQGQPSDCATVALEQIRRKAGKLHGQIRNRNLREFIAGTFAAAFFIWFASKAQGSLDRLAFVLLIAGILYIMWHLHRHGSIQRLPAEYGLTSAFSFHLAELTRQRDLLKGVVWWYLAPTVPGYLALFAAATRARGWLAGAPMAIMFVVVFIFTWWLNRRAVQKLNRQIEELFKWEERT